MPILNVDGCSIHYNVQGKGTPIVFIHPPLLTSINFLYQMEDLSQHYQVITFDIRGHGKSQYSQRPITYKLIAEDLKQLLDHLEIKKAFICGYSTGGSITLEFLLTFPDRALGGIIISGMPYVNDDNLRKKISLGVKLANAGAKKVLTWAISFGNADRIKIFKKMVAEARLGDIRNIEQYYRYSLQYNCTDQLNRINHPILLVFGKKDKSFHQYAMLLSEKLPNNELKFTNTSHQIPTKAANELNEMIKQFCNDQNRKNNVDTYLI
ncbi:alpha/beta fold hydrolase [Cytobacillus dafuensis]|uniref:Alpha/beta hydrolase n=1 Tax=Cytobacillus dafuensis TaxID=1742359 RepID=A0A5B8Z8K9_CYTDA|nr:alpha/beta hydrolase [Cytobacillus dafuensis]QED47786.1 alpha/beta hydrolase [Cytobacillus dafuensis]